MRLFHFEDTAVFQYNWSGKFIAPGPDWIHLTRNLWDYECIVVTEGTLYLADHENQYTVNPGEYLLMAPTGFQHGFRQSECSFYWMHFTLSSPASCQTEELSENNPQYLAAINTQGITLPCTGTLSSPERLFILLKQLQDSDRRYHEKHLNNSLCQAILCEIMLQNPNRPRCEKEQSREQLYTDIQTYIRWHCAENLKVSEVAGYFGYNEKYLTTFFRSMSGIPLKQYILNEVMEKAKATLSETNQTVSNIAYSLGFQDTHNFTHAFKKVTGMTPSAYRESYSKRNVFQV